MHMRILVAVLGLGLTGVSTQAVAQSLSGDTIHAYHISPTAGSINEDLGTFTAPGGGNDQQRVYYTVTGDQITFSPTPDFLGITFPGPSSGYNGFEFVDETADRGISGVLLDPGSTVVGFSASDAAFTSSSVSFNFLGKDILLGQEAIFDLQFASAAPVPEPATWAMMLVGFGAIGTALRGKRRRNYLRQLA